MIKNTGSKEKTVNPPNQGRCLTATTSKKKERHFLARAPSADHKNWNDINTKSSICYNKYKNF